jgi:hypothetical protein
MAWASSATCSPRSMTIWSSVGVRASTASRSPSSRKYANGPVTTSSRSTTLTGLGSQT